ncbi:hypothetical protein Ciccas_010973 [Cichlidogyrus casuarinus]|uniref:MMS19 nucleotide excision repair protein n=1 Tax=Cichlidogyrus casuarinus TaxID=1844966 RepID=A0ABD2PSK9_9PLAT
MIGAASGHVEQQITEAARVSQVSGSLSVGEQLRFVLRETFQLAASILPEYLPPGDLHLCVATKLMTIFVAPGSIKLKAVCLRTLDLLLEHFDRHVLLDEIVPFLGSVTTNDPTLVHILLGQLPCVCARLDMIRLERKIQAFCRELTVAWGMIAE